MAEVAKPTVTRLEPPRGWPGFALAEAWRSRELLVFLTERDLRIRYKQTFLGAAWAVGQPVITMVFFTLIFGRVAGLPSEGVPYPVFVLAGTVPWGLVASGLTTASMSLVSNQALIKKVYIHKMLVPASALLAYVVDVLIALVVLIFVAAAYGIWPSIRLLAVPAILFLGFLVVLGASLALSALNVLYRDVRFIVPYAAQMWMFATPIAYSTTVVDPSDRWWFALNPYVGVVEAMRWSVLGTDGDVLVYVTTSVVGALSLLVLGGYVFRRLERTFADVV